jgi:hypothetical protein
MAKKKPKKMDVVTLADLTPAMVEEAVTTPEEEDEYCDWFEPPECICGLEVEVTHQEGGGEGGGSHVEIILEIKDGEKSRFFRKTGYYASFVGTEWSDNDPTEVFPKQVTVTQYEAKK